MAKLDPDDERPSYVQVADRYRRSIESGNLQPGNKLPAHQQVADELDVSLGVVKRAYGLLQKEGLIVTRQGQGAYVRTKAPVSGVDPLASGDLADLRAAMLDLGRRLSAVEQRLDRTA